MAKFDIPESVKYNYMDLNNLQGMDSWDTNPSEMRASDMLNMVKKEGLHQVRHNVNQSYITGIRSFKNLCTGYKYNYNEETGFSELYCSANLEPSTKYTFSFYSTFPQKYLVNQNITKDLTTIDTLGGQRTVFTFTTLDNLDPSNKTELGWLLLYTNSEVAVTKNFELNDVIYPKTKLNFNYPDTFADKIISKAESYYSLTNQLHPLYLELLKSNTPYNISILRLRCGVYGLKYCNKITVDTINSYEKYSYDYYNDNGDKSHFKLHQFVHDNPYNFNGNEFYFHMDCRVRDVLRKTPSDEPRLDINIEISFKTENQFSVDKLVVTAIDEVKNNETSEVMTRNILQKNNIVIKRAVDSFVNVNAMYVDVKYPINCTWSELTNITSRKLKLKVTLTNTSDSSSVTTEEKSFDLPFTASDFIPIEINKTNTLFSTNDVPLTIGKINDDFDVMSHITYDSNLFENTPTKIQIEKGTEATEFFDSYVEGDDITYDIKYVGKIEEYDESGNPIPYYIKISEYMGEPNKKDDSELVISVWPTPLVKNIKYNLKYEQGFEKYLISSKTYHFTNYGKSGNRQGLYEHIEFDGKERVFTPIGILSFNCSTIETEDGYHQLNFEVENVLDNPYVPTIGYGSTPDGLDYSTYEPINLITNKRKFQFLSDGKSTSYQLPETNLEDYCKIKVLQENGTFNELTEGFSLNKFTGVITFTTAPSISPIDGQDNIYVEYEKKPTSALEANNFILNTVSNDNLLKADINVVKAVDTDDNTKINAQLTIDVYGGSIFDKSIYTINQTNLKIVAGSIEVYNVTLDSTQLSTINSGNKLTITAEVTFNNDGAIENRKWTSSMNVDYTKNTYKQTTSTIAGSKGGDTGFGVQRIPCLGFSWIGLNYSASATAYVGSRTDGSDSYWDVYVSTNLWLSRADYLYTAASSLYGVVDGEPIYAGSTGAMYGTSTSYPSNMLTIRKRIPYSPGKGSVSIGAYMRFGSTTNLSGTNYNEMSAGYTTLNLPTINLPRTVTTTSGEKTTGSTSGSTSFDESISKADSVVVKYDSVVPGSARLACYYGAKCVTVYGYESDRRIFVSDGTNCDTYSGSTLDGSSSITYFPDTNYRVLGEDTEIIGYAQKDGYLFTFKRGDDSVYVRYGTTLNDVTEFPSAAVTRNLQVLARPIQINDEILLITREGIKGMSYVSQQCRTELRSYFISNYFKLSADYDYDKMQWFKDDALLHIFLNEYEFTADMVSKSYVQEGTAITGGRYSSTLAFQYEWYVNKIQWLNDGVPPCVNVYQPKDFERQEKGIVYEYQREIGYNNQGVFEFSYNDYKVDKLMKIENEIVSTVYRPIKAHFITPFLNMGAINVAKTVKYVYINTRSNNRDMFAIGYIDESGYQETLEKVYNNIEDYRTKLKNSEVVFPKLIQIKSKIRKFMNIKMYIQNKAELDDVDVIDAKDESLYANTTFDRILVQYQIAGKYRGE